MPETSRAVFLSYASQDIAAVAPIAASLRAAGIEVWFDQSELRGGDAWDQKIRLQIRNCALFVPVISAHTTSRPEGYFRLEWAIADQRTQMIARNQAFIVPVCVDTTPEGIPDLPDSFHRVQWTRLYAGVTPVSFCDRIAALLEEKISAHHLPATSVMTLSPSAPTSPATPALPSGPLRPVVERGATRFIISIVAAGAIATWLGMHYFGKNHTVSSEAGGRPAAAVNSFLPPPHSLAVLPFVNMSADKDQEYFSDGLSEELLDSLAKVHDLQVAARTSSFSFKGEKVDIADIAHKLNVGALLEGSVRRDGNRVRITAQLINAVTGFHLWSETYDRDLKNVLALQSEIAAAVTRALQATLLPGTAAAIELGGTQNPAALDAYLHGRTLERDGFSQQQLQASLAAFENATRLDAKFAKAYASNAFANASYQGNFARETEQAEYGRRAGVAAQKALEIAPDLSEAHAAMAHVLERIDLDFAGATREYDRALELSPSNAEVLLRSGAFFLTKGLRERGLANLQRALILDPLNIHSWIYAASFTEAAGEYATATTEIDRALALSPANPRAMVSRGMIAVTQGATDRAIADCTEPAPDWSARLCLILAYEKAHRRPESDAQIAALSTELGNTVAYQFADIYAQRGEIAKALEWLETAYRLHDAGLSQLKIDRWINPLRHERRFLEIERKLFPET